MSAHTFLTNRTSYKPIVLSKGTHSSRHEGMCTMEAVAWLSGDRHTAFPETASEVIALYVGILNNSMPGGVRQSLVQFIPKLMNTRADRVVEHARNDFLTWKAIRVFTPAAMRAARLPLFAHILESQRDLEEAIGWVRKIKEVVDAAYDYHRRFNPNDNGLSPISEALNRALCSADWAIQNSRHRDKPFEALGYLPCENSAGTAAAITRFAYEAGCTDIWKHALAALDEVIAIRGAIRF